jgi:hypothetical protein
VTWLAKCRSICPQSIKPAKRTSGGAC